MTKDTIKKLALILLLSVAAFSMFRHVSELKARFTLQDKLAQVRSEMAALTQEKLNLLQELEKEKKLNAQLAARNVKLRAYLGSSKDRITRLFQDNSKTRVEFEETSAKFAVLKAENRVLIDNHKRGYLENEQLKLKLSSVVELKKAIRELKSKKFRNPDSGIGGNQGFLIKGGRSTFEKIKIEVVPVANKGSEASYGASKS
jgi:regulator of replication initiation timing